MAPKVGGGSPRYQAEAARLKQQIQAINERLLKLGEATGARIPLDREQREVGALQAQRHNQQAEVYNKAYDEGSPVYRQVLAALAQRGEPAAGPVTDYDLPGRMLPEKKNIQLASPPSTPAIPKIDEAVSGKVSYTPRQARPSVTGDMPYGGELKRHEPSSAIPTGLKEHIGSVGLSPQLEVDPRRTAAHRNVLAQLKQAIIEEAKDRVAAKKSVAMGENPLEAFIDDSDVAGEEVPPEGAEEYPMIAEKHERAVSDSGVEKYLRRSKLKGTDAERVREFIANNPKIMGKHLRDALRNAKVVGDQKFEQSGTIGNDDLSYTETDPGDEGLDEAQYAEIAAAQADKEAPDLGALSAEGMLGSEPTTLFGAKVNPVAEQREIRTAPKLPEHPGLSHKIPISDALAQNKLEALGSMAPRTKKMALERIRKIPRLVINTNRKAVKAPNQIGPVVDVPTPVVPRRIGKTAGDVRPAPTGQLEASMIEKLRKSIDNMRGGGAFRYTPPSEKPPAYEGNPLVGTDVRKGYAPPVPAQHGKQVRHERGMGSLPRLTAEESQKRETERSEQREAAAKKAKEEKKAGDKRSRFGAGKRHGG